MVVELLTNELNEELLEVIRKQYLKNIEIY